VRFMAGSTFSHGDQAPQFLSSFTCGNTAAAGASIAADRVTAYSSGCIATMTRKTPTTATMPIRILGSIDPFLAGGAEAAGASAMVFLLLSGRHSTLPVP